MTSNAAVCPECGATEPDWNGARADPDSLRAEIERLRAALKPFVAFGKAYPRPRIAVSAEDTILVSARDCHITLADVDRAAQALEQKEGNT